MTIQTLLKDLRGNSGSPSSPTAHSLPHAFSWESSMLSAWSVPFWTLLGMCACLCMQHSACGHTQRHGILYRVCFFQKWFHARHTFLPLAFSFFFFHLTMYLGDHSMATQDNPFLPFWRAAEYSAVWTCPECEHSYTYTSWHTCSRFLAGSILRRKLLRHRACSFLFWHKLPSTKSVPVRVSAALNESTLAPTPLPALYV